MCEISWCPIPRTARQQLSTSHGARKAAHRAQRVALLKEIYTVPRSWCLGGFRSAGNNAQMALKWFCGWLRSTGPAYPLWYPLCCPLCPHDWPRGSEPNKIFWCRKAPKGFFAHNLPPKQMSLWGSQREVEGPKRWVGTDSVNYLCAHFCIPERPKKVGRHGLG